MMAGDNRQWETELELVLEGVEWGAEEHLSNENCK